MACIVVAVIVIVIIIIIIIIIMIIIRTVPFIFVGRSHFFNFLQILA